MRIVEGGPIFSGPDPSCPGIIGKSVGGQGTGFRAGFATPLDVNPHAHHGVGPPLNWPGTVPAFLLSAALLAIVVAVGVAAIVTIRDRWLRSTNDQADWERTLAGCKNLRDEGVLTAEEFRNIRTLVEPRTRIGVPVLDGRQQPVGDAAGSKHDRE